MNDDLPLDENQIKHLAYPEKVKVLPYSQLKNFSSIQELFQQTKNVALLYEYKQNFGHWIGLLFFPEKRLVEVFDSLGYLPDREIMRMPKNKRMQYNGEQFYLSKLLIKWLDEDKRNRVWYNEKKIQGANTSTCGRYVALRFKNRNKPPQEFQKELLKMKKSRNIDKQVIDMTSKRKDADVSQTVNVFVDKTKQKRNQGRSKVFSPAAPAPVSLMSTVNTQNPDTGIKELKQLLQQKFTAGNLTEAQEARIQEAMSELRREAQAAQDQATQVIDRERRRTDLHLAEHIEQLRKQREDDQRQQTISMGEVQQQVATDRNAIQEQLRQQEVLVTRSLEEQERQQAQQREQQRREHEQYLQRAETERQRGIEELRQSAADRIRADSEEIQRQLFTQMQQGIFPFYARRNEALQNIIQILEQQRQQQQAAQAEHQAAAAAAHQAATAEREHQQQARHQELLQLQQERQLQQQQHQQQLLQLQQQLALERGYEQRLIEAQPNFAQINAAVREAVEDQVVPYVAQIRQTPQVITQLFQSHSQRMEELARRFLDQQQREQQIEIHAHPPQLQIEDAPPTRRRRREE